ncbi:hypothetical protein I7I53_04212 [Histoplasma capsulatum var. duboisii H88]|uniref:Uncharacterized protein n=1 Tax=Ajellomyces capsulatus (strain H88) TaxID=544711 RepID=A0A8A1LQM7_AJEC8|nr:hypothetical protein I7I53_04212 [Histoplasma capsulatum var. duboisii H88]
MVGCINATFPGSAASSVWMIGDPCKTHLSCYFSYPSRLVSTYFCSQAGVEYKDIKGLLDRDRGEKCIPSSRLATWLHSRTILPPLDLPTVLPRLSCTQCTSWKRTLLILSQTKSPNTSFQCQCLSPWPSSLRLVTSLRMQQVSAIVGFLRRPHQEGSPKPEQCC